MKAGVLLGSDLITWISATSVGTISFPPSWCVAHTSYKCVLHWEDDFYFKSGIYSLKQKSPSQLASVPDALGYCKIGGDVGSLLAWSLARCPGMVKTQLCDVLQGLGDFCVRFPVCAFKNESCD